MNSKRVKRIVCRVWVSLAALVVVLAAQLATTPPIGAIQQNFKAGVVAARNLVRGPNGQPIFAEFNAQGDVVNVIGEAVGELEGAYVLAGDVYRALTKGFLDFRAAHAEGIARGGRILSRAEYDATDFGSVRVASATPGGEPVEVAIAKPALPQGVVSVFVRAADTIITRDQAQEGPILLRSSIDLREASTSPLSEDVRAVLLNADGQILHRAETNIGYRVAFFKAAEGDVLDNPADDQRSTRLPGDTLWGPVQGARVYTTLAERFATTSDEDGRYGVRYFLPPCPGFTFEYSHHVIAELRFRDFNPRARTTQGTYYTSLPAFDFCNGLADLPFPPTLTGQMTRVAVIGIIATTAVPVVRSDIKVDVIMLTGTGKVSNATVGGGPVGVGETAYGFAAPTFTPGAPTGLDLDLDRRGDSLGEQRDGRVEVFFDGPGAPGPGGEPPPPDVYRALDAPLDFRDQGLLETISVEDLKETDLYVFRASNGQLVTERRGLRLDEYVPFTAGGVIDGQNKFFYRIVIRGPRLSRFLGSQLETFQQQTQLNPELHGREADHLRVGEQVDIIAINRRTGYVARQRTTIASASETGGARIDFPIGEMVLGPPNLKVKVDRVYRVESGLERGETRERQVTSEGGATTDDTYVAVSTEWFDHDGSPLPVELPGYTGRLAIVTGPNELAQTGDVAPFEIEPGRHLKMLRLQGSSLRNEHFYIHVSGEPEDRNPDFSATGAGQGPLRYRPRHYVPFKVAFLDEAATRARKQAFQYTRQDGLTEAESVPAVYRWHYRPEMAFSVLDLNVRSINREDVEGRIQDILAAANDGDPDTISAIAASDQRVTLTYDLFERVFTAGEFGGLTPFGPQRQYIFALGEDEVFANVGPAGEALFENLGHLKDLKSQDFLTIRLYQNADPENLLWEFAFGSVPVGSPQALEVSADDASLGLVAYLPGGIADRDDGTPGRVTLSWRLEGLGGSLAESVMTSETGVYRNTLTTSNTAGDEYRIKLRVVESDDPRFQRGTETTLGPYTVIPGRPAAIQLDPSSTTLAADQTSTITVNATVRDGHGNTVADGSSVSWRIDGDGEFDEDATTLETTDGRVSAEFRSGTVVGSTKVLLSAGEDAEQTLDIGQESIGLAVNLAQTVLNADTLEPTTVTVDVANAADGTQVNWFASRGRIEGGDTIIGGQATATLTPDGSPGDGSVIVTVAGEKRILGFRQVSGQPFQAELELVAIVGDETTDGFTDVEQFDGTTRAYAYRTRTNVNLRGTPGETVRYSLGTPLRPNAEPDVFFPLQNVVDGEVPAGIGSTSAMVVGQVTAEADGLTFEGSGHVLITASGETDIVDQLFASIGFASRGGGKVVVGPGAEPPPVLLVQQGPDETFAYRIELVEDAGQRFVEAAVRTGGTVHSVRHPHPIVDDDPYRVGLRYRDGVLELELEAEQPLPTAVVSVAATGTLENTATAVVLGRGFEGRLSAFRLGQERTDEQLLAIDGVEGPVNVTFGADGVATLSIGATGRLSGSLGSVVGVAFAPVGAFTGQAAQPVRFANRAAEWLLDLVIPRAEAGFFDRDDPGGVAVVDRESSGWFSSLIDKVAEVADAAIDVAKTGAELVSIIVGLDDFIVLTRALVALSFGATDEIDILEIAFAAVGAILTISAIVSAGSLAPVVAPLKAGLAAFKVAVKRLGPAGVRAGFGMAKALGEIIQRVIDNPRAALEIVEETVAALSHLVRRLGAPIFATFGRVITSAKDFASWVRSFKFFRRACRGAGAAPAPSCDELFEQALRRGEDVINRADDLTDAQKQAKVAELNESFAELQAKIVDEDGFTQLAIRPEAAEGIATMLVRGRNQVNVRSVVRDIVRNAPGNAAAKNDAINKVFRLMKELDDLPEATVGARFWGDVGKYIGNPGFLRGSHHQIEVMDDLRRALGNDAIQALEEGFTTFRAVEGAEDAVRVQRFVDITASGRHFEVKNFSNYGRANTTAVVNGLEKELVRIVDEAAGSVDEAKDLIDRIHFVFRGSPTADAVPMLREMQRAAGEALGDVAGRRSQEVIDYFDSKIADAIAAANRSTGKLVPDVGELVVFQGRTVPY